MIPPTAKPVLDETGAEVVNDPDGPMTDEQACRLRDLCDELGEPFDASLTEQQAVERIRVLRGRKEHG